MADFNKARMLELTQIIAAKTSFICSDTATANEPDALEAIEKARLELIDATDELNNLAKDPNEALRDLAWSVSPRVPFFALHFSDSLFKMLSSTPNHLNFQTIPPTISQC
jgi:hypothetical protein